MRIQSPSGRRRPVVTDSAEGEAEMRRTRRRWGTAVVGIMAASAALSLPTWTHASAGSDSGDGVVKLAADDGSPTFERTFNPYSATARVGTRLVYEPMVVVNTLDGSETPFLADRIRGGRSLHDRVHAPRRRHLVRRRAVHRRRRRVHVRTAQAVPALDTQGVWQQVDTVTADGNVVRFALSAENVTAVRPIEQTLIVPEHIWSGATIRPPAPTRTPSAPDRSRSATSPATSTRW